MLLMMDYTISDPFTGWIVLVLCVLPVNGKDVLRICSIANSRPSLNIVDLNFDRHNSDAVIVREYHETITLSVTVHIAFSCIRRQV